MSYDFLCFVVEPTLKSVQVCKDFLKKFESEELLQTKVCVIGNKIIDETDTLFIEEQLSNTISNFFYIKHHQLFRRIEKGEEIQLSEIVKELDSNLSGISNYFNSHYSKDWDLYKKKLTHLHCKISKDWYNDYYGEDISKLDISEFSFTKMIDEQK